MAASTTIVLSSSPCYSAIAVTPPHGRPATSCSSPSLPSPSQLFSSMPLCLPSGSRAGPIPSNVVAGFASASTLLRQAREVEKLKSPTIGKRFGFLEGDESQKISKAPVRARKEKILTESAVKEKEVEHKSVKKKLVQGKTSKDKKPVFKAPGLPRDDEAVPAQTTTVESEIECRPKASKESGLVPKKPRKKKSKNDGDGQTKIKQAKVTKPRVSGSIDKPKRPTTGASKPKANVASVPRVPISTQDSDVQAREEFRDLCLEKAIPIRRDWTPVRDTVQEVAPTVDPEASRGSALLPGTPPISELPQVRFGELLGDFGLVQSEEGTTTMFEAVRPSNREAIVKRRKIELVKGMSVPPLAEKIQRTKSPKKLQTVTAKATAPFMPNEPLETPSLLQYFEASAAVSEDSTNPEIRELGAPNTTMRRPSTKRSTKAKSTKAKAKKTAQPHLLSPESAMKTAKDQELIFGTSSQLAREESPSLIKDIHQAMKESNSVDRDWEPSQPLAKFKPYNSLALMESRNLWSKASRDLGGSLLEAEVVDLSETPKPQKVAMQLPPPPAAKIPSNLQPDQEESKRVEAKPDPITPKLDLDTTPTLQQQLKEQENAMPRSVAEAALRKRPKSRSPVKKAAASKPASNQMPNYQGFTDIQLSKGVSAYGFKTIKKREGMIVLLKQCWESKVAMALQELPADTSHPQAQFDKSNDDPAKKSSPVKKRGRPPKVREVNMTADSDKGTEVSVKKSRGRPRKDTTATTPLSKRKRKATSPSKAQAEISALAADDIYDSGPPTPSPPRRRSPPKWPAQLPLSQTAGTDAAPTKAATMNSQVLLFKSVTKAITTFPPSHDPKNLTFYEKMLMYEPVILEDLTYWLNAEGLGKVGEDNEVSPPQVKEWCEQRSVCCLWKENLRGGARARW